jgi:DNA (cytosine-5)-methyltransferase 1
MNQLKLGSLFDGSGGFPLAGALNGIEPVWASEVEPYPIAVTTSRFPYMKHLGDVSKVNGAEIEPVDIITFGSPCQDMSVAGKRAGIKHDDHGDEETTRSGLFYEAIRIIKEMRYGTEGRSPNFVVFENVPGAFSSNRGEDFRTVLEELVKVAEPTAVVPDVPQGGWAYADCWRGDGWSLGYRVFDAQHIRTAQRRKRIYLVLCLGDEDGAGKILFERDRLRGHYPQSGKAWERTPPPAEGSLDADDREGEVPYTLKIRSGCEGGGKGALVPLDKSATLATNNDQYLFQPVGVAYGISAYESNAMKSPNPHSGIYQADTSRCLDLNGGNTACNQGGVAIVEKEPIYAIDRAYFNQGKNALYDPQTYEDGTNPTIVAKGSSAVCFAVGNGQSNDTGLHDIPGALTCMHDQQAVCYGIDQGATRDVGDLFIEEQSKTLTNGTCPGHHNGVVIVDRPRYIVRRLTPTECARLQGFPDRWGDIDHKETMTDEEFAFWLEVRQTYDRINGRAKKDYTEKQILVWYNKLHNDGAEYKMWGNGIALPCALYVMEGIIDTAN